MIDEHELQIPVPQETQAVSDCSPQHADTFSLPSVVQEFRDMFEDRRLDAFDGDFSQIPEVPLEEDGISLDPEEYRIGVTESELPSQQVDLMLRSSSLTACASPKSPATGFSSASFLKDPETPTVYSKRARNTMTPHDARKLAARLSRELLVIDSLQARTRKLYHKVLARSHG